MVSGIDNDSDNFPMEKKTKQVIMLLRRMYALNIFFVFSDRRVGVCHITNK